MLALPAGQWEIFRPHILESWSRFYRVIVKGFRDKARAAYKTFLCNRFPECDLAMGQEAGETRSPGTQGARPRSTLAKNIALQILNPSNRARSQH